MLIGLNYLLSWILAMSMGASLRQVRSARGTVAMEITGGN